MKQLLSKVLPSFLQKFLIREKYKKYNKMIHQENIAQSSRVEVKCNNSEKYNLLKKMLKNSFGGTIQVQNYHFYFHPIAVIQIPKTIDEYLKHIGAKSRNMNKKAEKNGISCQVFDWNSKLDKIHEINTSSLVRQGREMDKAYREYPETVVYSEEEEFSIVHIGAFVEERLVGYVELYIYGNFAMTNRILGHKEYLKYGVMNLMIKKCVEYGIEYELEYINYLTMQNRKNNSLSAFKYRVGFRDYSLLELT